MFWPIWVSFPFGVHSLAYIFMLVNHAPYRRSFDYRGYRAGRGIFLNSLWLSNAMHIWSVRMAARYSKTPFSICTQRLHLWRVVEVHDVVLMTLTEEVISAYSGFLILILIMTSGGKNNQLLSTRQQRIAATQCWNPMSGINATSARTPLETRYKMLIFTTLNQCMISSEGVTLPRSMNAIVM